MVFLCFISLIILRQYYPAPDSKGDEGRDAKESLTQNLCISHSQTVDWGFVLIVFVGIRHYQSSDISYLMCERIM